MSGTTMGLAGMITGLVLGLVQPSAAARTPRWVG